MANKSIKISIATALNAVGITAARRALSALASHTANFAKMVGSNLMNIKAAFDIVSAGARKFLSVMSKGMEFERMTTTFKSLTGSMELARDHMKDLQDLGRTPPFSLEAFASASQMMMKMTDGMLGYKDSLETVGDIAAATGNDISQVGRAVGLAYQIIRDGQPFGSAGSQLAQLGVLTKKQVADFDELTKSGASNAEIWKKLNVVLVNYKGAMADTEKTTKGVFEAIGGEADVAMTKFSSAISDSAVPALEGLLDWLRRINEDGTVEEWANTTVEKLSEVADAFRSLGSVTASFWEKSGLSDVYSTIKAGAASAAYSVTRFAKGIANGESVNEAAREAKKGAQEEAWKQFSQGHYTRQLMESGRLGDDALRALEKQKDEAERKEEQREKRREANAKRRAEETAKAKTAAAAKVEEDMKRAEEERKQNDLKAQEEANAEEQRKAHETIAKQEEEYARKLRKESVDASIELAKDEHAEQMKLLDEREKKTQQMIDRLKARVGGTAGDVVALGGGGNWQAEERRAKGQDWNDKVKLANARIDAIEKLRKRGGSIDNPDNWKGLSNLERAALEKWRLDKAQKEAEKIAREKELADKKMRKNIEDIAKQLTEVGL